MSTGKSANFEKPKGFRAMLRRIGGFQTQSGKASMELPR